MSLDAVLAEIDAIFDRFHDSTAAPGCAFGVIVDGALVHAGGRGVLRVGEPAAPDADSVFRIASMTKSFTAATVLRLRDDGVLRLDDEVATWIPELGGLAPWSGDSPPITIRSLLTMTAGFPTDDPWGDRQQDLDADAFLRFLADGPRLAWPTGTQFEYANLGFAILGLIVSRATGEPYRAAVERRILGPLGLASTGYDGSHVGPERLARGYVRRDEAWLEEPIAGHGAFAPMGGLFSSVRDLAAWAAWFADAVPARDDPDGGAPLSRASRREMQHAQRAIPPELTWTSAASPPVPRIAGYGFGLFVIQDVIRGRTVSHSGGYPGFGSHMRWHPATGLGVVGLANGRYAQVLEPCREALDLLIDRAIAPVRRPSPWPATLEARNAVEGLLEAWDDDVADRLFAMNVELDEPLVARRATVERLRATHGRLRPDPTEPPESSSAAALRWWMAGDRGRVGVDILLGPERPPRVQWLELTSVPEPPDDLTALAERIVALLAGPGPSWPDHIALADGIDRAALDRELRATEAIFGPLSLGPATAGDGERKATWRLRGRAGDVNLSLERDPDVGPVRAVSLVPVTRVSPVHLD